MTNFFCASLPRSLRVFWLLNILLGVVCIGLLLLQKYILHHPNPYNLPLLPISRGADLMTYQRRFVYFHHVQVFSTQIPTPPYAYPAPVALLYKFFYLSHQHVHRFFYSLTGGPGAGRNPGARYAATPRRPALCAPVCGVSAPVFISLLA